MFGQMELEGMVTDPNGVRILIQRTMYEGKKVVAKRSSGESNLAMKVVVVSPFL